MRPLKVLISDEKTVLCLKMLIAQILCAGLPIQNETVRRLETLQISRSQVHLKSSALNEVFKLMAYLSL